MKEILDFLAHFKGIPLEQWLGLIALAGLGVCFFALYVILRVVTHRRAK